MNERIARFAAIMNALEPRAGREPDEVGIRLADPEQYAFLRVLSGPLYPITRVCKPVLQRLDEALSSGAQATMNSCRSSTFCHKQWMRAVTGQCCFRRRSASNEWMHRLANLVFLTHRINTRASNWSFERKKREYFASSDGSSPFVITQGVLQTERVDAGASASSTTTAAA